MCLQKSSLKCVFTVQAYKERNALTYSAFAVVCVESVYFHPQLPDPAQFLTNPAGGGWGRAELGMLSIPPKPSKFLLPARFPSAGAHVRGFTGLIQRLRRDWERREEFGSVLFQHDLRPHFQDSRALQKPKARQNNC